MRINITINKTDRLTIVDYDFESLDEILDLIEDRMPLSDHRGNYEVADVSLYHVTLHHGDNIILVESHNLDLIEDFYASFPKKELKYFDKEAI